MGARSSFPAASSRRSRILRHHHYSQRHLDESLIPVDHFQGAGHLVGRWVPRTSHAGGVPGKCKGIFALKLKGSSRLWIQPVDATQLNSV
jgi:hypothetical protein